MAQQTPDDFLKIFFSLFLENDIFSEDTNLKKFEKSIDISSNANGIYLLTIKTNTGLINKRVVIQ